MTYALVDLAEHVPGTPYRYKHGWVHVESIDARRVKDRKPLLDEIDNSGLTPFGKDMAHAITEDWSSRTYHPHVAVARDDKGNILGMINYDKSRKATKNYPGQLDIHDMRVKGIGEKSEGVGSALIQHVREVGKAEGRTVKVYNAVDDAVPFYEKTGASGFRYDDGRINTHTGEWADLSTDLAEHVPGTPDRFRHGWIPVGGKPVRHKTREEIHAAAVAKDWNRKHPPKASNVVDIWNKATPEEKADGLDWYNDAHFTAQALATHSGLSVNQTAGLLAVYSPQTPWATNMQRAARVVRTRVAIGGKGSGIMATSAQKYRAERILNGEPWQDVLTGRKIRAFASLIEHGQDDEPSNPKVVVDRHALSVASGDRASEGAYSFSKLGTKGKYEAVSKVFADAAKQISESEGHPISAHQVQAVTWLTRQRMNQEGTVGRKGAGTQAATAWKAWEEFARQYYPELLGKEATTGYVKSEAPEDVAHSVSLAVEFGDSEIDLAAPQISSSTDPQATATMQAPPDQDEVVQQVVAILLAGYAINKTAAMLESIMPGIPASIFLAAISNSGGMSGHRAHAKLASAGLHAGSQGAAVASNAAHSEVFYRAAYIVRAAERIGSDVAAGKSLSDALADEVPVFKSHEAARNNRLNAAARDGRNAGMFGNLLGWYLNPMLDNEPECIAADGHNFYADQGTVIGRPGAVHNHCGCTSGPPHEGAISVNAAIDAAHNVVFSQPRRYGLIRKAS